MKEDTTPPKCADCGANLDGKVKYCWRGKVRCEKCNLKVED